MIKFSRGIFILTILVAVLMYGGCGKLESLNDVELLKTKDVVNLLIDNGVTLKKATDFPINLSSCKVYKKEPQPYVSSQTGAYYMFYEYDGYSETSKLINESIFYEYPECDKDFKASIIPGSTGKNLYICLWYPKLTSWTVSMNEKDKKTYDSIIKEQAKVIDLLSEKAFDRKEITLAGKGDNWEVKIPIRYISNERQNEKGIPERVFHSSGQTLLRYTKNPKEPPAVTEISCANGLRNSTVRVDTEESVLGTKFKDGFYKSDGSTTGYNPQVDGDIIVKITWNNGQTEEITCTPKSN